MKRMNGSEGSEQGWQQAVAKKAGVGIVGELGVGGFFAFDFKRRREMKTC